MSIIQEALEKAQSNLKPFERLKEKMPEDSIEVPEPYAKPVAQKKSARQSVANMLTPAITIMVLAACGFFLSATFPHKIIIPQDTKEISTHRVSYRPLVKTDVVLSDVSISNTRQAIPEGILPPVSSPDLVLNGIMSLSDGPRAIINNSIVGVGDSISRAKIIKINSQSVIMEYRDAEITLSLK